LPHPLWEHYYAKALNQYYDSLERLSPYKDGGLEAEMRAVTIKALEKFWSAFLLCKQTNSDQNQL
jgi:hypothetical protein